MTPLSNTETKDTLGDLLTRAIDISGNEFAMGYDDSACEWHFHAGVRGNGRMILGTQFTSESSEIDEALKEYIEFRENKFKKPNN